jgi:Protein of unknown function (DUF3501)
MQPVSRASLLDYVSYEERREELRRRALSIKAPRRVHVADVLTFLFENTETVRYQIQEMMRAERIVREADINHELETYNELLGGPGELGCTLLIEIDDPAERSAKLAAWIEMPWHLYAVVRAAGGGTERVYARFDERQVGEERLSSVHYLKFATGGRVPSAIGVDLEGELEGETALDETQVRALAEDLAS